MGSEPGLPYGGVPPQHASGSVLEAQAPARLPHRSVQAAPQRDAQSFLHHRSSSSSAPQAIGSPGQWRLEQARPV